MNPTMTNTLVDDAHILLSSLEQAYHNPPPVRPRQVVINCGLPRITYHKVGSRIYFDLDFEQIDDARTVTSDARILSNFLEIRSLNRWVHDATFRSLDFNTQQLSTIEFVGDNSDSLRPDLVSSLPETTVVIEGTTSAATGMKYSLFAAYNDKQAKYDRPLQSRTKNRKIGFYTIVVSASAVLTNHPRMNDDIASRLCYCYRLAKKMVADIKSEFHEDIETTDVLARAIHDFSSVIGGYNMNLTGKKRMTASTFQKCEQISAKEIGVDYDLIMRSATWVKDQTMAERERHRESYAESRLEEVNRTIEMLIPPMDTLKFRTDPKTIVQWPLIFMNPEELCSRSIGKLGIFTDDDIPAIGASHPSPTFRLWQTVTLKIYHNLIIHPDAQQFNESAYLDMEKTVPDLLKMSEQQKPTRRNYHRIIVDNLLESDFRELAKSGVRGKKYSDHSEVKIERDYQKRRFHHSTDTDDIADFIATGCQLLLKASPTNAIDPNVQQLIEAGYAQHTLVRSLNQEFVGRVCKDNRELTSTNLYKTMRIIREIAHELVISRKQHCKSNEFIIKRLRLYKIWILIRTTTSTGPTFFSIMYFNNDCYHVERLSWMDSVFRQLHTNGTISWTEFASVNEVKLTNVIRADTMACVYFRQMQEISEAKAYDHNLLLPAPHNEHFLMQLLIFLHQKQGPADISCNMRYIYMEACTSLPRVPLPEKMLTKMVISPKSRLEVFINSRVLNVIRFYATHRIEKNDTSDETAHWDNCVSWINLMPVRTPRQVINYSYHGYGVGKSKHIEANSLGTLVENVDEFEPEMPPDNEGLLMGDKNPESIQTHEYSTSLMIYMFETMHCHLNTMFGSHYKDNLLLDLLRDSLDVNVDGIATLKASSMYCEKFYTYPFTEPYAREKMVTRVAQMVRITDSHRYIDMLKYSLDHFMVNNVLHVCLFPKEQVTGTREIYVLPLEARMAQRFVEKAARLLCLLDESEILMHPQNKYSLLHKHQEAISKQKTVSFDTYCTSSDKKRWNHGHHVSKFASMLLYFYPKEVHHVIFGVLSLWDRRRLMIPPPLLKVLTKYDSINTESSVVNLIHKAVTHGETNRLCDGGKTYMIQEHGFMQGLLHYTSSFFHGCFLMMWKRIVTKTFQNLKKTNKISKKTKLLITTMHSSDDSGLIISMSYENETERALHREYCALFEMEMKYLGKLLGLYESNKTASHCANVFEFNSKFTFGSSTEEPTLRHLNAVIQITEQESLVGRMDEAYSNLSQVLEHGGSYWLTSHFNYYQAIFHYQCLGSSISFCFPEYSRMLTDICDPSLGFFLMDDPRCCGTMGVKYLCWINSHKKSVSSRYKAFLKASERGQMPGTIALGISKQGTFLATTAISFGSREKAKRAFQKSQLPEDWRQQLEENYLMLYDVPSSANHLLLKLAMKFNQQGVVTSFSHGAASEMAAAKASPFALQRLVLSQIGVDLMAPDETWDRHKTSLMRELKSYRLVDGSLVYFYAPDDPGGCILTEGERQVLFHNQEDYRHCIDQMNEFTSTYTVASPKRDARKRVRLSIYEVSKHCAITLLQACKWRWGMFDIPRDHRDTFISAWELYADAFDWLRESIDDTLEASPFDSHIALANFLFNFSQNVRTVQLSTSPVRTYGGLTSLSEAIRYHYYHRRMLTREYTKPTARPTSKSFDKLLHTLYCVSTLPLKDDVKTGAVAHVLHTADTMPVANHFSDHRNNHLAFFQGLIKGDRSLAVSALVMLKGQAVGIWTRRQKKTTGGYHGKGVWEGAYEGRPFKIIVSSMGRSTFKTVLSQIVVQSFRHVNDIIRILPRVARAQNIDITMNDGTAKGRRMIHTSQYAVGESGPIPWVEDENFDPDPRTDPMRAVCDPRGKIVSEGMTVKYKIGDSVIVSMHLKHSDYKQTITDKPGLISNYRFNAGQYNTSIRRLLIDWCSNDANWDLCDLANIIKNNKECFSNISSNEFTTALCKSSIEFNGVMPRFGQFDEFMGASPSAEALLAEFEEAVDDSQGQVMDYGILMPAIDEGSVSTEGFVPIIEELPLDPIDTGDKLIFSRHPCIARFLNNFSHLSSFWYDICVEKRYVPTLPDELGLAKTVARATKTRLTEFITLDRRVPVQTLRVLKRAVQDPLSSEAPSTIEDQNPDDSDSDFDRE